jgi:flagellar assembly protein FliH
MILPSESAEVAANHIAVQDVPTRMLSLGERSVSRLEFHALNHKAAVTEVVTDAASQETEGRLKEDMAALDERLRSQMEETSLRVKTARSEARADARREWEKELEEIISRERTAAVLKAHEEFRRESSKYFASVEAEVVKLALAIAARVLHREATLDPLLLAGAVRVALDKVAKGSTTVLRVAPSEVELWREAFSGDTESSVQVVSDEGLSPRECVLDTNVGQVELGVRAQLDEIERGFFDLLQQRPA